MNRLCLMVVEWLTFQVPEAEMASWLQVEEAVWSRFLETCDGFLRKQMWVEEGDNLTVHAVIWWKSREHWHAISDDIVKAVDEKMGSFWRPCTMRVYDVVRDH